MRKSKFTQAQIVAILREGEAPSVDLQDLCCTHAISEEFMILPPGYGPVSRAVPHLG